MKEQIVEELERDMKDKKKMTKEYEGKINKRIFSNILIAIAILAYVILVILGSKNIENNIFIVYAKLSSIVISLISIIIFERSYRKADGKLCIYGTEMLMLAILTLISVYLFQIEKDTFALLMAGVSIFVPIYYLIKSIGIYVRGKKEYIRSQNDISEIVKEDLPETVETKRRRETLESQMREYNRLNNENKNKEEKTTEIEEDDNEEEVVDIEENDGEEDPYPRIVNEKSRVIKTSSRKVDISEGFDEEEEEYIIFDDDYREKKAVETKTKKSTKPKTTTKKSVETETVEPEEVVKPKRGRKPAASKAKETEVEEKAVAKKTTAKKTTTTKKTTTKKTETDEEETKPKRGRKPAASKAKKTEVEEKPAAKKTTAKKATTTKNTTTKKKSSASEE